MRVHPSKAGILCIAGVCMALYWPTLSWAASGMDGRRQVVLEGKTARVSVDVAGGSIVDFHFLDSGLNPFTWNYPEKGDSKPRTMGHFVCFDRWGQPSEQEAKNGMPFHGEAAQVVWTVLAEPSRKDGAVTAEMSCDLPIGGMSLRRTLSLSENSSVLTVREEITNDNKLGRLYNIVQHPTIGPGFLDESVLVDTNAWKGFSQTGTMPTPEEPALYWPKVVFNGELVDLRTLVKSHDPNVVSFVFSDSLSQGWVTACNPGKGLLVGYIWALSDYPWLNIWRHIQDGRPAARGMEFGTTGLHQPFPVLLTKGKIFGRPLFEYLDAGQKTTKSYALFLAKVPAGFKGVKDVAFRDGNIRIREQGEKGREIIVSGK
jgi:hypothetical protein